MQEQAVAVMHDFLHSKTGRRSVVGSATVVEVRT